MTPGTLILRIRRTAATLAGVVLAACGGETESGERSADAAETSPDDASPDPPRDDDPDDDPVMDGSAAPDSVADLRGGEFGDAAEDATNPAGPRCGDGALHPGEDCDDGNDEDGDGCSSRCAIERCGDGLVQPGLGEQCEPGSALPVNCSDSPDDAWGLSLCDSFCLLGRPLCPAPQRCGDGALDPDEACDDGNHAEGDGCAWACDSETCGDGTLQPAEACDGALHGVAGCDALGFTGGSLSCTPSCRLDRSACVRAGCEDRDGDGAGEGETCPLGIDCNDGDLWTHPGAPEVCNYRDDDCDGVIDNGCP